MRGQVLFLCIVFLFLICRFATTTCAEPLREPWGEHDPGKLPPKEEPSAFNPLRTLVEVHRNYLSPIDGKECPMYPSCSQYSLLCFEKHGLFIGWVMTCDRLLHEADEMRNAPMIYVNGEVKYYDPLANNDFWWYSER